MAHAIGDTSTLSSSHALVLPLVLIATRVAGLVDDAAARRPLPACPHAMPPMRMLPCVTLYVTLV